VDLQIHRPYIHIALIIHHEDALLVMSSNLRPLTFHLMGWEPIENTAISILSEYAFTGSHALAVGNKTSETQVFAIRRVPFRASYVTGQVYWPKTENISVSWAQVCLGCDGECVSISPEPGQWNPFFIDLQQIKNANDIPYSEKEFPPLYFQGALNGVSQENPHDQSITRGGAR
jgi:hypothetical protein